MSSATKIETSLADLLLAAYPAGVPQDIESFFSGRLHHDNSDGALRRLRDDKNKIQEEQSTLSTVARYQLPARLQGEQSKLDSLRREWERPQFDSTGEQVGQLKMAIIGQERLITDLEAHLGEHQKRLEGLDTELAAWKVLGDLCGVINAYTTLIRDNAPTTVSDGIYPLLPSNVRARIDAKRAEEQRDAIARAEQGQRRAEEVAVAQAVNQAQKEAEFARIDTLSPAELAAMFFKDGALEAVLDAIHNGPLKDAGIRTLAAYAGRDDLWLSDVGERALERLLEHFGLDSALKALRARRAYVPPSAEDAGGNRSERTSRRRGYELR